jgi:hypothetical protein
MSRTILHKHHIIPKHAGGTDDPSNLIYLTVEEHAEAHKLLFEQYGRWQDELAWKGLLKLITHDEAMIRSMKPNLGKKFNDEHKRKISQSLMGHSLSEDTRKKISNTRKERNIKPTGYERTKEIRIKMSESAKKKAKLLCSCGKLVDPANHARWHRSCL